MSKKGENIHKRKDGRWEARVRISQNGQKKYKSIYGKTYKDVKDKLLHFHNENKYQIEKISPKITFGKIVEEWFVTNQINLKESTKLKYHILFEKHILPQFKNIPINEISILDVNKFLTEKLQNGSLKTEKATNRGKPLAASYVRTMGILMHSVLDFAVKNGYCDFFHNTVMKPAEKRKNIDVLNKKELEKLEEALKKETNETGLGIMLALHAGLRIGEVCALSWDDIDFDENIIHVTHTIARVLNKDGENEDAVKTKLILDIPKTKSSIRDIPINSKLLQALKKAKKLSKSNYVVSDREGFINLRTFEYRYHKLLKKYGITDINFHVLRHTFSTRCVELEVDIKSLSEVLGHSNVSTTLGIYVHSSMDLKRIHLEKLATNL